MNKINISKDKIIQSIINNFRFEFDILTKFWFQLEEPAKQVVRQREKFAQSRHAIHQSGLIQLIFDGRREMSSLSLKTVVVYKSIMTGTNLQKGGLVHWAVY